MRIKPSPAILSMLLIPPLLTGCGSSTPSSKEHQATNIALTPITTPAKTPGKPKSNPEGLPTADIALRSSAPHQPLPAQYTCDGTNTPLPLNWTQPPNGTAELAIWIVNLAPIKGKIFIDWAITGINPSTHQLTPGQLPPGTITGKNSLGQTSYNICPPKHTPTRYVALLLALPHKLPTKPGYNAHTLLKQALHAHAHEGELGLTYQHQ
jgi:phosphatidylethanolamine-binding protein (PEBP) family uncharacterized protein